MRVVPFALLASVLCAQAPDAELARSAAASKAKLAATRRTFHADPELSGRETRTAARVAERLKALGLEVRTGVGGKGVVADLRGGQPGPWVALRADMDALPIQEVPGRPYGSQNPGVMHACGHDVHMTVALGAAELLAARRSALKGNVRFLFQPAEEGAPEGERAGALAMIEDGALEPKPKAIFAFHVTPDLPAGTVGFTRGPALAGKKDLEVVVRGKAAHGAMPHKGVDAIVVASEIVTACQTVRARKIDPNHGLVVTFGTIHGGVRSNVIAEEVKLSGTLRFLHPEDHDPAVEALRRLVEGIAAAHGASAELRLPKSLPPVVNPPALVEASLPLLATAGVTLEPVAPWTASEDFAYFQKAIPGFMAFLGVGQSGKPAVAPLHSPGFDADEEALVHGARAMAAWALGMLK